MALLASPTEVLKTLSDRFTPDVLAGFENLPSKSGKNDWEYPVIVGLARRCFGLQKHLIRAHDEKDAHYLAWAARTLFELKVLTAYVFATEANVERFWKETFVDANDAVKRTSKAVSVLNDKEISGQTDVIMAEIKPCLDQKSTEAGVSADEKYLNIGKIAKEFGFESEHSTLFMLLSKFAHASGLSTNIALLPDEYVAPVRDRFLEMGAENAIMTMTKLSTYAQS